MNSRSLETRGRDQSLDPEVEVVGGNRSHRVEETEPDRGGAADRARNGAGYGYWTRISAEQVAIVVTEPAPIC